MYRETDSQKLQQLRGLTAWSNLHAHSPTGYIIYHVE